MMPALRFISVSILLAFASGTQLCAQQLHLKNWKKRNYDKTIPLNTLVSASAANNDSVSDRIHIHGYFKGADDSAIVILPIQIQVYKSYQKIYEQGIKDTGLLAPVHIALDSITSFSIHKRKINKDHITRNSMPFIAFAGILGLAPLTSVNHAKGTVNSSLYGLLVLTGYFSPMIIMEILDANSESTYTIRAIKPANPARYEYFLRIE